MNIAQYVCMLTSSYYMGADNIIMHCVVEYFFQFPDWTSVHSAFNSLTHIQMAYVLFHEAGLMETFHVPQREFVNFFRALEANYGSNVCKLALSLL